MKWSPLQSCAFVALTCLSFWGLVGCAIAQAGEVEVESPPAQYDFEPPNMMVIELPLAKVESLCSGSNYRAIGCTMPTELHILALSMREDMAAFRPLLVAFAQQPNACVIVIPQASFWSWIDNATHSDLRRHERAHCNGWRHKPMIARVN